MRMVEKFKFLFKLQNLILRKRAKFTLIYSALINSRINLFPQGSTFQGPKQKVLEICSP